MFDEHRAFIVENYLTQEESVTATVSNFRNYFQLKIYGPVPDRKTAFGQIPQKITQRAMENFTIDL